MHMQSHSYLGRDLEAHQLHQEGPSESRFREQGLSKGTLHNALPNYLTSKPVMV